MKEKERRFIADENDGRSSGRYEWIRKQERNLVKKILKIIIQ